MGLYWPTPVINGAHVLICQIDGKARLYSGTWDVGHPRFSSLSHEDIWGMATRTDTPPNVGCVVCEVVIELEDVLPATLKVIDAETHEPVAVFLEGDAIITLFARDRVTGLLEQLDADDGEL